MGTNFKSEEEVKEYLKNLHIEYRFGCHSEKNPETCHLLGDFQEAIKKDFTKAGQTYKENCDERNFALSCRKYGGYAVVGKGMANMSPTVAYKYMSKGCELGDVASCTNQGILATTIDEQRKEGPIDFPKGIALLEKGCIEHGIEKACYYLSSFYFAGVPGHVEKNLKEAHRISVKGCELGNAYSCANVSQMHARGDGTEKNAELAELFKKKALAIQRAVQESKGIQFGQGVGS